MVSVDYCYPKCRIIITIRIRHDGEPANTYAFGYDKLNRLTGSDMYVGTATTPTNSYTERGLNYDKNGNILALQRYGSSATTPVDDYTYHYVGNKLDSLSGTVNAGYGYDANGNMIHDGRRNLDISYNYLNLVDEITDSDDEMVASYTYLADGTKVGVTDADGNGYVYLGSMVYAKQNETLALESAGFGGGRINATTNGYEIAYHITDHLGSTRAIVVNGEVVEQNDYYPFGEKHQNANLAATTNRYQFNGKELQTTGNFNVLDYGARMYDSNTGRWFVQDPLAEQNYSLSSYNYCANNPIKYIDPDGLDIWEFDSFGYIINQIKDTTKDAFYMVEQVDGEWQRIKNRSIDFEYGTIKMHTQAVSYITQEKITQISTLTYFTVKGDDNATALFEFMANPTETTMVEWGHIKTGSKESGDNYVGTIHQTDKSAMQGYIMNRDIEIREAIHNHPGGSQNVSPNDIKSADRLLQKFPNAKSYIYTTPPSIYIPYNKDGILWKLMYETNN